MRPNPSETADLVTFIEKILDEKLHFLCSIRSRKNCIFFQFPFSYILKQYIFNLCTILWIRGFRLELSFTSQSESYSVPDMDFFIISSIILSQLPFSRTELPKLTPSVSIEHFDHFSGQFYFYMLQPIRLDFSKVYLQARCIFI